MNTPLIVRHIAAYPVDQLKTYPQNARTHSASQIQQLANYRRESLKVSHAARMAILKDQLDQSTDEKIRRMRQSQIDAADAEYTRRARELDDAIEQADITSDLVAQGVIRVAAPQ